MGFDLVRLPPLQHFIGSDGALAIGEENRIAESRRELREG